MTFWDFASSNPIWAFLIICVAFSALTQIAHSFSLARQARWNNTNKPKQPED